MAIDLFSGAGGMSLGFEQAGFDVLVAVDSDPVHLAVHQRNFPLTKALCRDAATLTPEELQSEVRTASASLPEHHSGNATIDCIFGGPSCQGFSAIGRRDPNDPRNSLLEDFARLVEEIRPRSFVMENVPGLLDPAHTKTVRDLTLRFRNAGYLMADEETNFWKLSAADFGVPQLRTRLFLVGVRIGETVPMEPTKMSDKVTVSEALDDLPDVDVFEELAFCDWAPLTNEEVRAIDASASSYAKRMRQAADGLARARAWDASCMTSSARTMHTRAVRKRFLDTRPGSEEAVSRNPRLKGDAQSTTLRAGTGRDHGSFSAARPIHHRYPRVVTVREAARLHSFPDWFRFNVTKWHGFRQVGNSVPPFLARAVAERVVEALGCRPNPAVGHLALGKPDLLTMSLEVAADYFGYDRSLLPMDSRLLGGPGKRNWRSQVDER